MSVRTEPPSTTVTRSLVAMVEGGSVRHAVSRPVLTDANRPDFLAVHRSDCGRPVFLWFYAYTGWAAPGDRDAQKRDRWCLSCSAKDRAPWGFPQ